MFVSCVTCVRSCARILPGSWPLIRARVLLCSSPPLLLLAVAPPGSRLVSWLVSRCPCGCPGLAPSVSRLVFRCSGGCPGVASPVSPLVSRLVSRPPPPRHGPVVSRWCPGWCPGLLLAVASCCPDGVPWCPGVSRLVSRGVPGCPGWCQGLRASRSETSACSQIPIRTISSCCSLFCSNLALTTSIESVINHS